MGHRQVADCAKPSALRSQQPHTATLDPPLGDYDDRRVDLIDQTFKVFDLSEANQRPKRLQTLGFELEGQEREIPCFIGDLRQTDAKLHITFVKRHGYCKVVSLAKTSYCQEGHCFVTAKLSRVNVEKNRCHPPPFCSTSELLNVTLDVPG